MDCIQTEYQLKVTLFDLHVSVCYDTCYKYR